LAEFLGPLAKIVVKRAVAQTRNPEELHAIVARSLDREDDRRKFLLRKAEVLSQKSKAPSAPPEAAPLPEPQKEVRSGSLEVTAAELDRAVKLLTPYVGPIASVLVKKAARNVDSLSALYLALAGHVKEAAGRRTFLRDAGFREP
jgi:serine/threonine-protein kinase